MNLWRSRAPAALVFALILLLFGLVLPRRRSGDATRASAELPASAAGEVVLLDEQEEASFTRRKLLFFEPAVGSFEGLLLLPHGDGPHPAILGLHGHRDTDRIFVREFMGEDLSRAGFAVLVPRLRAHHCSLRESRIALTLLEHGFTLMGLRAYEALLMLEVLAAEPGLDPSRTGIPGHSGGASTGNLVIRITGDRRPVAAYVTDHLVDYLNACGLRDVHCETVPALAPIAAAINDLYVATGQPRVAPYAAL